jgi:fructose-1,6-bisphosphatase
VAIQSLVKSLARSKLQRLLIAEAQHAEHAQALVDQVVHSLLQSLVEIDHHIAAQDDVKLVEGTVGRQVMLGEDDVGLQRGVKDHVVVMGRVIIRELVLASGPHVVARVFLHRR